MQMRWHSEEQVWKAIDDEPVWHGGIDLLGKEDALDNMSDTV